MLYNLTLEKAARRGERAQARRLLLGEGEVRLRAALFGDETRDGGARERYAGGGGLGVRVELVGREGDDLPELHPVAFVDEDVGDTPDEVEPELHFAPTLDGGASEDLARDVSTVDDVAPRWDGRDQAVAHDEHRDERDGEDLPRTEVTSDARAEGAHPRLARERCLGQRCRFCRHGSGRRNGGATRSDAVPVVLFRVVPRISHPHAHALHARASGAREASSCAPYRRKRVARSVQRRLPTGGATT